MYYLDDSDANDLDEIMQTSIGATQGKSHKETIQSIWKTHGSVGCNL